MNVGDISSTFSSNDFCDFLQRPCNSVSGIVAVFGVA